MKTIRSQLLQMMPENTSMELPPRIFNDMQGEFIEFIENQKLVARFPNLERYMNPFGFMQGGIIVAAIDNTIAPFSYVSAPANITQEINTQFKRPIKASDKYILVEAGIVEKSSTHIILKADVLNGRGKLAATATANCVYIADKLRNVMN